MKSIEWNQAAISAFDLVLISTHHAKYNLEELVAWAPVIVDTRNALVNVATQPGQVTKA
jgi:UDP-N-acetyl-D-glucosamine dehydrogenase